MVIATNSTVYNCTLCAAGFENLETECRPIGMNGTQFNLWFIANHNLVVHFQKLLVVVRLDA